MEVNTVNTQDPLEVMKCRLYDLSEDELFEMAVYIFQMFLGKERRSRKLSFRDQPSTGLDRRGDIWAV
jgi:hypothetical protein